MTIVKVKLGISVNEFNTAALEALNKKGIVLSKFWITEETIEKLHHNNTVRKLFNQTKLNTSYLVTLMNKEGTVFIIGDAVAHTDQLLSAVNRFNLYIAAGALLLTIGLSWLISRQIVKPLTSLQHTAEDIAKLKFRQADIHTGDEIQKLAESINIMSDKLEQAQEDLEKKNQNLRTFISDASHELKSPIALIKVYLSGIKDGMDDGTFLDVIDRQNESMSIMVGKLLSLAKLQSETYHVETFDFVDLIRSKMGEYGRGLDQTYKKLHLVMLEDVNADVLGDRDKIAIVLDNFITNAMKYSATAEINITISQRKGCIHFTIANQVYEWKIEHTEHIWQPFYVFENSRNKQLTGTGLGLSIVQAILEKHDSSYGYEVDHSWITFYFELPLVNSGKA
ncbi:signal transduction histidine kinase [Paenibacillus shirakamiensis]|uniref:histidine kinase n=1 Tax=Paenibacillus shirakamiensis TaxID=1265935 RepID=A0ABS4JLT1_9BACL|nr:signal transduction histidine kinase [Paenibacillus shirakamiensis]